MAFDVSFHPVDRDMIVGRILPYIQGVGSVSDLVDRCLRIDRLRVIAKSWGLGMHALSKLDGSAEGEPQLASAVTGLGERVLPDLHVWGRPFLITDEEPADVARSYERWVTCDLAAGESLAREMIDLLVPLASAHVQPAEIALHVPADRAAWETSWRLDLLRDSYAAYGRGTLVKINPDVEVHPLDLIASEIGSVLLDFWSSLQPAWIAQGYSWPTYLFEQAGLGRPDMFGTGHDLFQPILAEMPDIDGFLGTTLGGGQRIGGYVAAENAAAFAELLDDSRDQILDWAGQDGWRAECERDLRKLRECVSYAQMKGIGMLEASHLYNTPFGLWN